MDAQHIAQHVVVVVLKTLPTPMLDSVNNLPLDIFQDTKDEHLTIHISPKFLQSISNIN